MGRTRKRVTFLVLSLEAMGLLFLALAIYLVGDSKLECRRVEHDAGIDGPVEARVACEASARRIFGLLIFEVRRYEHVLGAHREEPALGRFEHWLVLDTADGGAARVLPGSKNRTDADLERLRDVFDGRAETLIVSRSAAPLALGAALFGCLWIFVISLIMREFLGFHEPWWWRWLRRRRSRDP